MDKRLLQTITETLKAAGNRGTTPKQLATACRIKPKQQRLYRECLRVLLGDGTAVERGLRIYHGTCVKAIKATVTQLKGTFGFVATEDGQEHFVIGRSFLGAMPGDVVQISPVKSRGELPEAEIIAIVEPGPATFTGTLCEEYGKLYVMPDNMRIEMAISRNDIGDALVGDKVMCRVVKRGADHRSHRVAVVMTYGCSSAAHNCTRAILDFNAIPISFPEDVLEEAVAINQNELDANELNQRSDLRGEIIFTIDGADTKDIDDAISVKRMGDMYELGVHIADVSYYVKQDSKLEAEAFNRGTSIYFADSVIPMLPPELSNGICSLNPNVDRFAFSCIMAVTADGLLSDYRFEKTVINSRVKGVYSEINQILDGTDDDAIKQKYAGLYPTIALISELADKLTANKHGRGAPEIETIESKIILDENKAVVDVQARSRGRSEVFIEEFMLMANQAAASAARMKEVPFVYRVHEPPAENKLAILIAALKALGINSTGIEPGLPAAKLSKLIENARGKKYFPVVNMTVLRTMSKAKYFVDPIGHYGLALENYAQFTSPIRRYPDLTIHRILSEIVRGTPVPKVKARYAQFALQSASRSTETELTAMRVERSCEDCYKAEYMKNRIGVEFDGIISSVAHHGLYVALPNSIEGLVKMENLPVGRYVYDELYTITNESNGKTYSIGDEVRVKCIGANVSGGKVDFEVVAAK